MTKFLNLNDLSGKEVREVQIDGVKYQIKEMSVEDFIETTRVAEQMKDEPSYGKQLQATIELVTRAIPNVNQKALLDLSLDQMKALTSFIRGADSKDLLEEASKSSEGSDQGNV